MVDFSFFTSKPENITSLRTRKIHFSSITSSNIASVHSNFFAADNILELPRDPHGWHTILDSFVKVSSSIVNPRAYKELGSSDAFVGHCHLNEKISTRIFQWQYGLVQFIFPSGTDFNSFPYHGMFDRVSVDTYALLSIDKSFAVAHKIPIKRYVYNNTIYESHAKPWVKKKEN